MVRATDLLAPKGRLDPVLLFPEEANDVVEARLGAYLAEASAQLDALTTPLDAPYADQAAAAWAYHRAYDAVAQRMNATPQSVTLTDGTGMTQGAAQAQTFADRASDWLDRYNALLDGAGGATPVQRIGTQGASTEVSW